jgi:Sel1 repeat
MVILSMAVRLLVSVKLVLLFIVGCAQPQLRQSTEGTPGYGPPRTCTKIYNVKTLDVCKNLAVGGDPEAAMHVGDAYGDLFRRIVQPDPREALYWYSRAADLGYLPALRKVFDFYYFGSKVPKNDQKAEEYLLRAAGAGAQWAQLLLASRLEKSESQKALVLYLNVARTDNYHAQARLAKAYYAGDLTAQNLTKAYFWLLLAKAGGLRRESESHPLYNPAELMGLSDACSYSFPFQSMLGAVTLPRSSTPRAGRRK